MMVIEENSIWCDPCLEGTIRSLNLGGLKTVASCCGHGSNFSTVLLADGRWIVILPDHESFSKMDTTIPEAEPVN